MPGSIRLKVKIPCYLSDRCHIFLEGHRIVGAISLVRTDARGLFSIQMQV